MSLTLKIDEKVNIDLRYQISFENGLNIVPVDYCAKIMYFACTENYDEKNIHLVYPREIPHTFYFPLILESLNIEGVVPVDYYPENHNKNEVMYYRSLGKVFSPYMTSDAMNFNTANIVNLQNKYNIRTPSLIDNKNFKLLNYAKSKRYGLFK